MTRLACLTVLGVLLLTGCADRLVDLPTARVPAVPVDLASGPVRCPANTVARGDQDPASGAGAVPGDFDARTVLRCFVDYTTARSRNSTELFTVDQWQEPLRPELLAAFDLPDRELRPARACAAATGGATAVYLVDTRRRSVRVLLPYEDPCQQIRSDVAVLLPTDGSPPQDTFDASRTPG